MTVDIWIERKESLIYITFSPILGIICTTTTILRLQEFFVDELGLDWFAAGRLLADCIENVHALIRSANPHPDWLQYIRIIKGICLGQLFHEKRKKGHTYGLDDSKQYLTWLEKVKEMEQKDELCLTVPLCG